MKLFAGVFLGCFLATIVFSSFAEETGEKFSDFAGFSLGKGATLSDVMKVYGPAKLIESGEAGEYQADICYKTSAGLVFFLSGEMGWKTHDLHGFAISQLDETKPCALISTNHALPKPTLGKVHLGMTKNEFEKAVINKVRWRENIGRVFYRSKQPMTEAEISNHPEEVQQGIAKGKFQNYFDVVISVKGTFFDGRLTEFRVWKERTE